MIQNFKNIVKTNGEENNAFFKTVFLPIGYPESVSKDYLRYQVIFKRKTNNLLFSLKNKCLIAKKLFPKLTF